MRKAFAGAEPTETVLLHFQIFLRGQYHDCCQNLDVCAIIVNTAIFLLEGGQMLKAGSLYYLLL